jgi:ABC-type uncharacterized transport system permease subunit
MLAIEIMSLSYGGTPYIAHDVHLYGFVVGSIASFGIDYSKAIRGLIISILTVIGLYYWFYYFNLVNI